MLGSLPLEYWYVSYLSASVLVLLVTGYAVYTRTEAQHRSAFVGFLGLEACWLLTETAKLLVRSPQGKYALSLLAGVFAMFGIGAFWYFATAYTNRSLSVRTPRNAVVLAWLVVAVVGPVTDPVVGLYYDSVSYQQGAVTYLATTPGPLYLLNVAAVLVLLSLSLAYLARLFVESPHRPESSILLLAGATGVSLVPNALSTVQIVPVLPGFDYSSFGLAPFVLALTYVVFFRGERDLAPMARTEIVDDIDDALFGLDDAGQVIDYNAAARALLTAETDDPVGTPFSELLPELAQQVRLPDTPDEDVLATYTTVTEGERTHYSVSVSPIDERGTVAGYSVILRDVTAAERAKRELERQNEQLESFASTVAHDLRNPLQIADGTTTLLTEDLRTDGSTHPAVDHLDRIADAISRMDTALSQLQTLAKHAQSVTETELLAFAPTVRAKWADVDTAGLSLSVPTDGTIQAESTRLDSILETLFRHSAEYGGPTVVVELTESGFRYADHGLELPDDDRTDVFAYDATATDGIGLGLKIVRTQAESQGWSVSVDESEDGTTFYVTGAETTRSTTDREATA